MILCMLPIYESFLYNSNNKMMIRLNMMNTAEITSLFTPTDDDDIDNVNTFKSIATSYLFNKFRDCQGDSCRDLCDKKEVADLVRGILNAHHLILLLPSPLLPQLPLNSYTTITTTTSIATTTATTISILIINEITSYITTSF